MTLAAGETREVVFTVAAEQFMLVGDDGRPRLEPGQFRLSAGGCSPGARGAALGAAELLSTVFDVVPT